MKQLPLILLLTLLVVPTFIIGGWLAGSLVMQTFVRGEGDPKAGRKIALDPKKGNCVICHQVGDEMPEQQGNLGPPLAGVADRLTRSELFERIEDARRVNPETMMPPYGSTQNLHRVAEDVKGEPILADDEITDVVAWLETLSATGEVNQP